MDQRGGKRAVVFGGAGFIGTQLLAHLTRSGGFELVVSGDIVAPKRAVPGVRYEDCDVRRPIDPALCQGASVIYNLAAVHRTPGHPDNEYYETNLDGALNVCAFAEAVGARHIAFTSSIAVYGASEDQKVESSELKPVSAYGHSKLLAEKLHQAWASRDADHRLVIVRPGVIFGPGEGGNFTRLASMLQRKLFFYPGRKDTIKACGYVGELIRAIDWALALERQEVIFNFTYPGPITIEEICMALHEIGRLPKPRGTMPISLASAAATAFEAANAVGIRNPINRQRIAKLHHSTNIRPEFLLREGYQYETTLSSGLQAWLQKEPAGEFR